MDGVAVLHPQDCLKDHRGNLFSRPMKSRRTIKFYPNYKSPPSPTPKFTVSDNRRRTPPKGMVKKKDRNTEAVVTEPSAVTASKNLAMGQVTILKRGEVLNESCTSLKDVNDRKVSNGAASTPEKPFVSDGEAAKVPISGRRVLPTKKKAEKDENSIWSSNPNSKVSKAEDVALLSSNRLQMEKSVTEFFAGSAFTDSPPPSSVPLPGFFTKNLVAVVREDLTTDLRRILGLSLS